MKKIINELEENKAMKFNDEKTSKETLTESDENEEGIEISPEEGNTGGVEVKNTTNMSENSRQDQINNKVIEERVVDGKIIKVRPDGKMLAGLDEKKVVDGKIVKVLKNGLTTNDGIKKNIQERIVDGKKVLVEESISKDDTQNKTEQQKKQDISNDIKAEIERKEEEKKEKQKVEEAKAKNKNESTKIAANFNLEPKQEVVVSDGKLVWNQEAKQNDKILINGQPLNTEKNTYVKDGKIMVDVKTNSIPSFSQSGQTLNGDLQGQNNQISNDKKLFSWKETTPNGEKTYFATKNQNQMPVPYQPTNNPNIHQPKNQTVNPPTSQNHPQTPIFYYKTKNGLVASNTGPLYLNSNGKLYLFNGNSANTSALTAQAAANPIETKQIPKDPFAPGPNFTDSQTNFVNRESTGALNPSIKVANEILISPGSQSSISDSLKNKLTRVGSNQIANGSSTAKPLQIGQNNFNKTQFDPTKMTIKDQIRAQWNHLIQNSVLNSLPISGSANQAQKSDERKQGTLLTENGVQNSTESINLSRFAVEADPLTPKAVAYFSDSNGQIYPVGVNMKPKYAAQSKELSGKLANSDAKTTTVQSTALRTVLGTNGQLYGIFENVPTQSSSSVENPLIVDKNGQLIVADKNSSSSEHIFPKKTTAQIVVTNPQDNGNLQNSSFFMGSDGQLYALMGAKETKPVVVAKFTINRGPSLENKPTQSITKIKSVKSEDLPMVISKKEVDLTKEDEKKLEEARKKEESDKIEDAQKSEKQKYDSEIVKSETETEI